MPSEPSENGKDHSDKAKKKVFKEKIDAYVLSHSLFCYK